MIKKYQVLARRDQGELWHMKIGQINLPNPITKTFGGVIWTPWRLIIKRQLTTKIFSQRLSTSYASRWRIPVKEIAMNSFTKKRTSIQDQLGNQWKIMLKHIAHSISILMEWSFRQGELVRRSQTLTTRRSSNQMRSSIVKANIKPNKLLINQWSLMKNNKSTQRTKSYYRISWMHLKMN